MEETAKIPADEEAVDEDEGDLPKDFTYPSLIYERLKNEEKLKRPLYAEITDEEFNAAWEAIIGDNLSQMASLRHRNGQFLCDWKEDIKCYRRKLLERELELRIPTYSKSDEDLDVAWEAILVDNPTIIAPFSHQRHEFLDSWKESNETLRRDMLFEELKMRTPSYSKSDEDFNTAWEAILVDNPSLVAPFSDQRDEFSLSWKQSNEVLHRKMLFEELKKRTPSDSRSKKDFNAAWEAIRADNPSLIAFLSHCKDELLSDWRVRHISGRRKLSCRWLAEYLADGYAHSVVERLASEGRESESTTQSPVAKRPRRDESITTKRPPIRESLWERAVRLIPKTKRKK